MFAVGVGSVKELSESDYPFDIENQTSGTITIVDNDGVGDIGITFWVSGIYDDANENGIWDVCENVQVTIKVSKLQSSKSARLASGADFQTLKICIQGR